MDIAEVNHLLWKHDLMGTCCNQMQGMEDEYWACADGVSSLLKQGLSFEQAVRTSFEESFWEGCFDSSPRKDRFEALLNDVSLQAQGARI